jgi:predicted kinase
MPRFTMLCGPAGSGKTTFRTNLLKDAPNTVVISSDDILMEWAEADGISYQEAFLAHREKTNALMEDVASAAFEAGLDVIWDQTHLTREVRRIRLIDVPDNYDRVAVAFSAPEELLKERVKAREERTGKVVPDDVVHLQAETFELPDYDEGFDSIVLVSEPGRQIRVL